MLYCIYSKGEQSPEILRREIMKKRKWILKNKNFKLYLYKNLKTKKVVYWDLTALFMLLAIPTAVILLYKVWCL